MLRAAKGREQINRACETFIHTWVPASAGLEDVRLPKKPTSAEVDIDEMRRRITLASRGWPRTGRLGTPARLLRWGPRPAGRAGVSRDKRFSPSTPGVPTARTVRGVAPGVPTARTVRG